ncbi:MAG TPA: hypothetical protein VGX70_13700 [Gemmataceae bacterium]|nr:hypothetical protein [Gemmataceae bacterium]
MSLLILDDQLDRKLVQLPIERWITCQVLHDLRPDELILDDRIPEILNSLSKPTFVTIDQGFWHPRWCHANYCILCFVLRTDQQNWLPKMLQSLLRHKEFRTRTRRMGKVARVSRNLIEY